MPIPPSRPHSRARSSSLSDPPGTPDPSRPTSPALSTSSSSSDESGLCSTVPQILMSSFGTVYSAEVTQASASHAPLITRGTIGPRQLDAFEHYAKRYFSHKGIGAERQVEKVLYNIDSSDVRAWVKENESELKSLTFPVFMTRLRGEVLSTDWMWETAQALTKKQGEEKRFAEWASNLREANDTLSSDTRFYISPDKMRNYLLLHCHDDLRREYQIGNKDGCYDGIKEFSRWFRTVADLDMALAARKAQISKHLAAAMAASSKQSKNVPTASQTSKTPGVGNETATALQSTRTYVYALTTEERSILDEHQGCYQCRKLYVDHRARDCPDKGNALTLVEYADDAQSFGQQQM